MAELINAFLKRAGLERELGGQGQSILEASGASGLDELVDLVEELGDLKNLQDVGFKVLHVKKLFRAIVLERSSQGILASGSAAAAPAAAAAPLAQAKTPFTLSLLEKSFSTVPEDALKEPSSYVAVKDVRLHERHHKAPAPENGGEKIEVPTDLSVTSGPMFFDRSGKTEQPKQAWMGPETIDTAAAFQDAPGLPAPGKKSAISEAAAAERAVKMAELAVEVAQQAREEAVVAANAGEAGRMLKRGPRQLGARIFDRTVEFTWARSIRILSKGKHEHLDSPISKLSLEDFQTEFTAALKTFCDRNPGLDGAMWDLPEIEAWRAYEPDPKTKRRPGPWKGEPHALVTFLHEEDASVIRQCYTYYQENPRDGKFMDIKGQMMRLERPNPNLVSRAASSHGSETGSQAPSEVGSENSHSSSAASHRNLTLLFLNIPEQMASSTPSRPSIMSEIKRYVAQVLAADGGMPIDQSAIKCSASFVTPRPAPPGGCWLTFTYALEGKRINKLGSKFDDGKAYSLQAYMEAYRKSGQPEKTDQQLQQLWWRCEDAISAAEKLLAGGGQGCRPISIATYFLDRVKAIDRSKKQAVAEKQKSDKDISLDERRKYIEMAGKTWTTCEMGGRQLSVEFRRMLRGL